jgi:hypothetical protein
MTPAPAPRWPLLPLIMVILGTGLLLLSADGSAGQTAKQGDFGPNAFQSPMVLETVFPPSDPSLWVAYDWTPVKPLPWTNCEFTTVESHGLGKYSCDGLYFRNSNRNGSCYAGLAMIKVKPVGAATALWFNLEEEPEVRSIF